MLQIVTLKPFFMVKALKAISGHLIVVAIVEMFMLLLGRC